MKKDTFRVIYLNDNITQVACDGFYQSIILAMAEAIIKGNDPRIKYIYNTDTGVQIENIEYPSFKFSK